MEHEGAKQFRLHWKNDDKSNNQFNKRKKAGIVGLVYFLLFLTIFGASGIAVVLLKVAWGI